MRLSRQRPVSADNPILLLVMSNLWRKEWRKLWKNHCFNQGETSRDPQAHTMESLQIFCRGAAEQCASEAWFLHAVFFGSQGPADDNSSSQIPALAPPIVQREKEEDPETTKFRRVLQHYVLTVRGGERAVEEAMTAGPIADELVQINDDLTAAMWGNPDAMGWMGGPMPTQPDLSKINQRLREIWSKANGSPITHIPPQPLKPMGTRMPLPSLQHIGVLPSTGHPSGIKPSMSPLTLIPHSAKAIPKASSGTALVRPATASSGNAPLRPVTAPSVAPPPLSNTSQATNRPFNASLGVAPNPLAPNKPSSAPASTQQRSQERVRPMTNPPLSPSTNNNPAPPLTPFKRPYQDGPGAAPGGYASSHHNSHSSNPERNTYGTTRRQITTEGRHGALSKPVAPPIVGTTSGTALKPSLQIRKPPLNPLGNQDSSNNTSRLPPLNPMGNNTMMPPGQDDGGDYLPPDSSGDRSASRASPGDRGPPPPFDGCPPPMGMPLPMPPMGMPPFMPPMDMPPFDGPPGMGMPNPNSSDPMSYSMKDENTGSVNKMIVTTVPKSRPPMQRM